jgi:hypothetical protein
MGGEEIASLVKESILRCLTAPSHPVTQVIESRNITQPLYINASV